MVVDEILPHAVSHCYTEKEIKRLISPVAKDGEGRLPFHELQDIILKGIIGCVLYTYCIVQSDVSDVMWSLLS